MIYFTYKYIRNILKNKKPQHMLKLWRVSKNMQKYKQAALILAILTLVLTAGVTSSYAYSGEYEDGANDNGQKERRILVLDSFEKNDYKAWRKVVGRNDISKVINEDKFNSFVEARTLARKGKYDESFKLSYDLGLELQEEIDIMIKKGKNVEFDNIVEKEDIALLEQAKGLVDDEVNKN